jgi:hypothetical protein
MNRFWRRGIAGWGFQTVCIAALLAGGTVGVSAGSCGNPVLNPMAREFTLSLEMGYLNRDMEYGGEKDDLSSYSMALKGTYGITSRFAIFGRLGMSDLRLDSLGFGGALEPSFGAGLMVALFRAQSDPSVNIVLSAALDRLQSSEGSTDLSANYFSSTVIATKGVKDFLLYGGVRLSGVDLSGDRKVPGLDSDDPYGFVAGMDYGISERIYLMAEAHLFDEYALSGGIGFNFGR